MLKVELLKNAVKKDTVIIPEIPPRFDVTVDFIDAVYNVVKIISDNYVDSRVEKIFVVDETTKRRAIRLKFDTKADSLEYGHDNDIIENLADTALDCALIEDDDHSCFENYIADALQCVIFNTTQQTKLAVYVSTVKNPRSPRPRCVHKGRNSSTGRNCPNTSSRPPRQANPAHLFVK